jgi:hypothetical protein
MRRVALVYLAAAWLWPAAQLQAAPVKLPSAAPIELELQHHITSAYVGVGTPIYFRVAHDVVVDGHTLIARGTLVRGQMRAAADRDAMATSGAMSLGIRSVQAVDGKQVRVVADMTRQGRDRDTAMALWSAFWGLPGLLTRGKSAHVERGTVVTAQVLNEAMIEPQPAAEAPDAPPAPAALTGSVTGHKYIGPSGPVLKLHVEESDKLGSLKLLVAPPAGFADLGASGGTFELIAVDGVAVPERVLAGKVGPNFAIFDTWSIVRFCRDGVTELRFRARTPAGEAYDATYPLTVRIISKK